LLRASEDCIQLSLRLEHEDKGTHPAHSIASSVFVDALLGADSEINAQIRRKKFNLGVVSLWSYYDQLADVWER
jgi:hypothetical protein